MTWHLIHVLEKLEKGVIMIDALDDQGNVWKCVEGGQPRVSEPKWILMKDERQR